MDKNTLTGLLLMGAVILGFTWLNRPSEEEIAARMAEQTQAEQMANQDQPATSEKTIALDEGMIAPGDAASKVVLANDLVRLEISERGGMITSACLNDYNSFAKGDTDTSRVNLIREADSHYGLTLTTTKQLFKTYN